MSDNSAFDLSLFRASEVNGTIEHINGMWHLSCSRCGPLLTVVDDGTEPRHQWVVDKWSAHDIHAHGGDGVVELRGYIEGEVSDGDR